MKKLTLIIAGFLMSGMISFAQVTPFTISGKVTNLQSIPAIGQTVYIIADSSQAPYYYGQTIITDSNGNYSQTIQPPSGKFYSFFVIIYDCHKYMHKITVQNDSVIKHVNFSIIPSCKASFNYSHAQSNSKRIIFSDNSTGNITSWLWNFGDGTTSTLQNPNHIYQNFGWYPVSLRVTNNSNCRDSITKYFTIYYDTNVNCTSWFTYIVNNRTVSFQAFNSDSTATASYSWDFGDGHTATGASPVHTFNSKQNYNVCLNAILINSQNDTCFPHQCQIIEFCKNRNAWFTFTINSQTVNFQAFNSDSASIASYSWDFGDGHTATGANPVHTFSNKQLYYVTLSGLLINSLNDTCAFSYSTHVDLRAPNNYIFGKLYGGNYTVDHAIVYLIYFNPNDSTLTAIDTVTTWDSTGICTYNFINVPLGKFLVKAALTSTSTDYSHLMPTYYGNKLYWDQASYVTFPYQNGYMRADIYMTPGNNPGGPGFIGGKTSQGANIWGTGDPLGNIQVLLLDDNDNPIAFTYSKASGDFGFNSIAYDTYKIYAEIPGKTTDPAIASIDASKPSVNNIKITIGEKQITNSINDQLSNVVKSVSNVFPNPAYGDIHLEISAIKPCTANIQLINSIGQIVQTFNIKLTSGNFEKTIPTTNLEKGLYNIKLIFNDGLQVAKPVLLVK
jgi:PKD repeat protein